LNDKLQTHPGRGGPITIRRYALTILLLLLISQPLFAQPLYHLAGRDAWHDVKKGESFYGIARAHGLGLWHLRQANPGVPKCRPGARLLLPVRRAVPDYQGSGVLVNLPERVVYVFAGGRLKAFYPVAIGQSAARWQTPTGSYKVTSKAVNPTWYPPKWAGLEEPVPPGPENPLGDRWIGLSKPGYGFHGTPSLHSIGLAASHGCMRMYPESVQELYRSLKRGSRVELGYRPVLLSVDEAAGECRLSVFPDIYGRAGSLQACAAGVLKEAGLERAVDKARLQRIIGRAAGVPEWLLGTKRLYFYGRRIPIKRLVIREKDEVYLEKRDLGVFLAFVGLSDGYSSTGMIDKPLAFQSLIYRYDLIDRFAGMGIRSYRRILGRDYLPLLPLIKSAGLSVIGNDGELFLNSVGVTP